MIQHPAVSRKVALPSGLLVAEQAAVEPVTERQPEAPDRLLDPLHRRDIQLGEVFWLGGEHLQRLPDAFDRLRDPFRVARYRDPAVRVERAETDLGLGAPGRHIENQRVRKVLAEPGTATARDENRHGKQPATRGRHFRRPASAEGARQFCR